MSRSAFLPSAAPIFLLLSQFAFSAPPPWEGLPEMLPSDFPRQLGFLEFSQSNEGASAPLAVQVMVDGAAPSFQVFQEQFLAFLPSNTTIQASQSSQGREVWQYPVGTTSVHVIDFDSEPAVPFEMRLVRQMTPGHWAFGAYRFESGRWVLNKASGVLPESFTVRFKAEPGASRVDLKRINPLSCRNCHFMNSELAQFPTRESAGPCGFVPWNETLSKDWEKRFESEMGYRPIIRGR